MHVISLPAQLSHIGTAGVTTFLHIAQLLSASVSSDVLVFEPSVDAECQKWPPNERHMQVE